MNILLHICCSNCTTYPFKILREENHLVSAFWFNPNIHPAEEYRLRLDSLKRLSDLWHMNVLYAKDDSPAIYFKLFDMDVYDISYLVSTENGIEKRERCKACYRLRLTRTAEEAAKRGCEAFSTTLLISPYQDFNEIVCAGKELAKRHGLIFYEKDFRPYFRASQYLSRGLGLYRQNYCGCIFSMLERQKRRANTQESGLSA